MDPPLFTAQIRGEALWEMLEENLQQVFATDPFEQMGGYVKRALGLKAYLRPENPRGHRLCELFVNDQPLERSRTYHVVYATPQAVPEKYAEKQGKLDLTAIEALRRYFAAASPINAALARYVRRDLSRRAVQL
jgi:S-sulfosulfanyl-L-cysteine sulfohydrolase